MWTFPRPTGTVVVGCDSSWESRNAVVAATLEASRRGTELILLAVAEHRPYWPVSVAWVDRAEAASAQHAQAAVDRALARVVATDPAVAVQTVIVNDFRAPELIEVARQAGVLVLGRRGHAGQVAFSRGSTSSQLAKRFHCPMLVVHDPGSSGDEDELVHVPSVVAWMDTIDGAATVLSVAVNEAVVRDLPLIVVHTLQPGSGIDRAVIDDGWNRCRVALRQARVPYGDPDRLVITEDDPVQALLQRVGADDLLVLGTCGEGRVSGLITGSVSREILDIMTCDVMVVPPAIHAVVADPPVLVGLGRS